MIPTSQLSESDLLNAMLEADRQVQLLTDPALLALAELRFRNAFVIYQLGVEGINSDSGRAGTGTSKGHGFARLPLPKLNGFV